MNRPDRQRPRTSLVVIGLYLVVALFADLIAGGRPIYVKDHQNRVHFPVVETWLASTGLYQPRLVPPGGIWKSFPVQEAVWPLIPFGASETNLMGSVLLSPLNPLAWEQGHYLGTDALGRDVLSGIVQGARFSIGLAGAGMLFATALGLVLGVAAGWWDNNRLRMRRWIVWAATGSLILAAAQLKVSPSVWSIDFLMALLLLHGGWWALWTLVRLIVPHWAVKLVSIRLDSGLGGLVVLLSSFPAFLLVLSLSQSIASGAGLVIVSLTVLGWPLIALLARDESRRLRRAEFIEAGLTLGFRDLRLLVVHVIPHVLPRLHVAWGLGMAQAVLVESALSFLGFGLPLDVVSWGSLIASAQSQPGAWWLVAAPGLALLGFVVAMMHLGETTGDSVA